MYDIIILGGGPAGLTAGIYSGRANLKTLILEPSLLGGQMATTIEVENYPGAGPDDTGMSLAEKMSNQADSFGVEVKYETPQRVDLEGKTKEVETDNGTYQAKVVILAMGREPRKLGIPGEDELAGRGVSYCATCDGAFYQGGDIYVIGGGNSAVEEANFLTRFADKVYIVHRRDELRADLYLQDRIKANDQVEVLWNSTLEEIKGDTTIEGLVIKDTETGETREVERDPKRPLGVFFYVGSIPRTEVLGDALELKGGYVVTDENMETSLPGVYAIGDVRDKKLRQIATAVGDGAIAANAALAYLED